MLCSVPAGLTSRPDVRGQPVLDDPLRNPYTVQAQARLALQLAAQLGVRQVVLGGHTDGALVALEAAASACRWGRPAFPILAQSALDSVLQSCSHAESCAPGDGHRLACAFTGNIMKGGGCVRRSSQMPGQSFLLHAAHLFTARSCCACRMPLGCLVRLLRSGRRQLLHTCTKPLAFCDTDCTVLAGVQLSLAWWLAGSPAHRKPATQPRRCHAASPSTT